MDLVQLKGLLIWSSLINYAILLIWFFVLAVGRKWMLKFHGQWFPMSEERFAVCHYALMGGYKLLILVFNLVPAIVVSLL